MIFVSYVVFGLYSLCFVVWFQIKKKKTACIMENVFLCFDGSNLNTTAVDINLSFFMSLWKISNESDYDVNHFQNEPLEKISV